jgi:hypothetical protein
MKHLRFAVGVALATSTALAAQQADAKTHFIIRKGNDTLAIERFSRDAGTLTGDITQSNGLHWEYVANLRQDNTVEHVELSREPKGGPVGLLSVDFADTLVKATFTAGTQSQNLSLSTLAKPLPFLLLSFAFSEQIVRATNPVQGRPVKWMAVRLGAGDTATMTVTRVSADSVTISVPQGDLKLSVSSTGDVLGALFPPQQWVVERKSNGSKP